MSNEEEKEIILEHNEYKISLTIKNNYEESKNILKKKLFFQDKDLKNYELYYVDEDDDENAIEEDNFDEAFNSSKWILKSCGNNEEIRKNIDNIQNETQNEIDQKLEKIKEDLKQRFMKIANQKIAENSLKYEEKIKKYEEIIKSLKEKNKKILKQVEEMHESSVKKLINDISDFTEKKIENELTQYNENFNNNLKSIIDTSINEEKKSIKNVKEIIEELNSNKDKMKDSLEDSRLIMSSIFNESKILNQK